MPAMPSWPLETCSATGNARPAGPSRPPRCATSPTLLEALGAREAIHHLHAAVGQPSDSRPIGEADDEARQSASVGEPGRATVIEVARRAIDDLLPATMG